MNKGKSLRDGGGGRGGRGRGGITEEEEEEEENTEERDDGEPRQQRCDEGNNQDRLKLIKKKREERRILEHFMKTIQKDKENEIREKSLNTQREIVEILNRHDEKSARKLHIVFPSKSVLIENDKRDLRKYIERNSENLRMRKRSMSICQRICLSLLNERVVMRINKPTVEDLVKNHISFEEITKIYTNSYNSWGKLMNKGLIKKHITHDRWLSVDNIIALKVNCTKLYNAIGFRLEDFILFLIGPNEENIKLVPKLGIDASFLLSIGFSREEMMEQVNWSLSSMIEFLRFEQEHFKALHLNKRDYRVLAKGDRSQDISQVEQCFGFTFMHKQPQHKQSTKVMTKKTLHRQYYYN